MIDNPWRTMRGVTVEFYANDLILISQGDIGDAMLVLDAGSVSDAVMASISAKIAAPTSPRMLATARRSAEASHVART